MSSLGVAITVYGGYKMASSDKGAVRVQPKPSVASLADDVLDKPPVAGAADDVLAKPPGAAGSVVDDVLPKKPVVGNVADKVVKITSAEETNQWFRDNIKPDYKPPYKPGTVVNEIELINNSTFVRVYDNMPDGSGMYGSWMMKLEDINGLTAKQIRDKFASQICLSIFVMLN